MGDDGAFGVRVWCRDCCGEDDMGCFDGREELQDAQFETREGAEAFGATFTKSCPLWEFEVVDLRHPAPYREGSDGR